VVGRRRSWVVATALGLVVAAATVSSAGAAEPRAGGGSEIAGVPSEVQLQVLSYRVFKAGGNLHMVGELRNTSAYRVNGFVTVGIAPGHSTPSETLAGSAAFINLAPGSRAPFSVGRAPFAPSSTSVQWITAGGTVVQSPAAAIGVSAISAVTSDPALVGGTGDSVRVEVRNGTHRAVQMLTMAAAFRGTDGKVSNVGGSLTNDIILAPGEVREDWVVSATPSGTLAVKADVDVWAYFADGAHEPVVSWQNWFQDIADQSLRMSIAWAAEQGVTVGCAPYRYCPTANVTRAQMAIFLVRAFDIPPATGPDHFSDDNGMTGESSINALFEAGITGGCNPGLFCPTANVTRAHMAIFLVRVLGLPPPTGDHFSDDSGLTGESQINSLYEAGVTGGCGPGTFCPKAPVTRAQMAAFLQRALALP
jgi:hypothetical protein